MALPATAHHPEPANDTIVSTESPHLHGADDSIRTPSSLHNRNNTPSISPLSTTSRSHADYFVAHNQPLKSPTPQLKAMNLSPTAEDVDPIVDTIMRDDDRDDRSSSLSDFEGNFDDQENNHTNQHTSPPRLEEADSEAETERLERTPQKSWINPDTGRTPSKLNQETTIDDHMSEPDSSPKSPHRDLNSPSPTHRPIVSTSAIAGLKRKRPTPPSEPDSPLSEAASDSEDIIATLRTNGVNNTSDHVPETSVEEANAEETTEFPQESTSARETPEPDELDENPYISPMKAARLKGKKQRAKRHKEAPTILKEDYDGEDDDAAQVDELQEDDDSAAKSEEDRENKKQAQAAYASLADKFNIFRAKLHGEKLAAAEAELDQLNRPQPIHPDYVAQLHCIAARRDLKIQQECARLRYKIQALQTQTLAEHAQLHTQFFQEAREIREDRLSELGTAWYDIQKERRQCQTSEVADKYTFKFPTKYSDQIRNQANYNREVSIISGLQRYVGFPAAPEIHGARSLELDDDLKAMKLPRQQPLPVQPPVYQNQVDVNGMAARAAQEKWVEQNPWANAQHPFHQQSRSPMNFSNPHANPSVNLFRQGSAQDRRTNSPFTTPLPPQKRADYQPNGMGSAETIGVASDPPSSAIATVQTNDKSRHGGTGDDGSPISSLKVRSALSNPLTNREDRRNFSNISSTSTIDAPGDSPAGTELERRQNPYAGLMHAPMSSSLPTESSNAQTPFPAGSFHAQHGKPDDRRAELFENANFRPTMGAYSAPLFANGSPVRKEGQRAT